MIYDRVGDEEHLGKESTHLVGFPPHHILVFDLFQSSRVHGMVPVHQLLSLLACNLNVLRICYNDVVTAVRCQTKSHMSNVAN